MPTLYLSSKTFSIIQILSFAYIWLHPAVGSRWKPKTHVYIGNRASFRISNKIQERSILWIHCKGSPFHSGLCIGRISQMSINAPLNQSFPSPFRTILVSLITFTTSLLCLQHFGTTLRLQGDKQDPVRVVTRLTTTRKSLLCVD